MPITKTGLRYFAKGSPQAKAHMAKLRRLAAAKRRKNPLTDQESAESLKMARFYGGRRPRSSSRHTEASGLAIGTALTVRRHGSRKAGRAAGRVLRAHGVTNPATHAAQSFISSKISKLMREGRPQRQAVAIAYSMARKAGYRVPARNPLTTAEYEEAIGDARRDDLAASFAKKKSVQIRMSGMADGRRVTAERYYPGSLTRHQRVPTPNPAENARAQEVADAFAAGQTHAVASNFYVHGNRIYSYGPHFPIAEWRGGKVIFTSRKSPSVTTSKHMTYVRRALSARGIEPIIGDLQMESSGSGRYVDPHDPRSPLQHVPRPNPRGRRSLGVPPPAKRPHGFYVMGRYTSASWWPTKAEAEAEAKRLNYRGGQVYRVEQAYSNPGSPQWEVIVGNIGRVHSGPSRERAEKVYKEYVDQSKRGYGRAAGEGVTLLKEGEIVKEHAGTVDTNPRRGRGTGRPRKYLVGGTRRVKTLEDANALAQRIFEKTGSIVSIEEFRARRNFPMPNPKKFITLTEDDIGKKTVPAFGGRWNLGDVLGSVQPRDVGKRVYLVGGILQAENEEQRRARMRGSNPRGRHNPRTCNNPRHQHALVWQRSAGVTDVIRTFSRRAPAERGARTLRRQGGKAGVATLRNPGGSQGFDVYLRGKWIDKVFYSPGVKVTPEEVKRSLVNHDGYDPAITVRHERRARRNPLLQVVSLAGMNPGRGRRNPSVSEISLWIDNDEGLYNWWRSSRLSKTAFIRQNKAELDAAINRVLGQGPKEKTWRDYAGSNPLDQEDLTGILQKVDSIVAESKEAFESKDLGVGKRLELLDFWRDTLRGMAHVVVRIHGPIAKRVLGQIDSATKIVQDWGALIRGSERGRNPHLRNPLTRVESRDLIRRGIESLRTAKAIPSRAGFYAGRASARLQTATEYTGRGRRRLGYDTSKRALRLAAEADRVGRAATNPVPMPNPVNPPFKNGQRIPVGKARAWIVKSGNRELLRQFDEAQKLQAKANKPATHVVWQTIDVGDPKKVEMVTAMAHYGDSPETYYVPPKGSKKGARTLFRHKWGDDGGGKRSVPLLAASGGKALIMPLTGKKVAGDWLRH